MWYTVCLPGFTPTPLTVKQFVQTSHIKWFNPHHDITQGPRIPYLCSFSCLWSESILYMLKWQKEHKRAFFVCTLWMCASIAHFVLGAMPQFPHLYVYLRGPNLIIMGISMNPDTPGSASCLTFPSSSISSVFTGDGLGVGVGGHRTLQLPQELRQLPWPHFLTHTLEQSPALRNQSVILSHLMNGWKYIINTCIDSIDNNTTVTVTLHT